jgi:hypothetical protein
VSFRNPTSMIGLQLLNLWLLKVMLRCVNDGVMTMKPRYQTTGKAPVIWSHESFFMLFPYFTYFIFYCKFRRSKDGYSTYHKVI